MGTIERKEREKLRRREEIIDAAEVVIFSKGYENATMDDVAREAELSKGTLYLYFSSKEELYFAIVKRGVSILESLFVEVLAMETSGLCKISKIGENFIKFYSEHEDYYKAMMDHQSEIKDLEHLTPTECELCNSQFKIKGIMIEVLKQGMIDKSINENIDPEKTALLLWAQTVGVLQMAKLKPFVLQQYKMTKDDFIQAHFEMIVTAIT